MLVRPLIQTAFFCVAFGIALPVAAASTGCQQNGTQLDLSGCAQGDLKVADTALSQSYQAVLARLREQDNAPMRTALVNAQRSWIGYRDAECAFEASGSVGGSMQPMEVDQCLASETKKRTAPLSGLLSCNGGDCLLPPL